MDTYEHMSISISHMYIHIYICRCFIISTYIFILSGRMNILHDFFQKPLKSIINMFSESEPIFLCIHLYLYIYTLISCKCRSYEHSA
jgi:hypothetical protein